MKVLNIALFAIGIVLLACGYFSWLTRHESVEIRSAQNIMVVLAGWSMTVMGYLGLTLAVRSSRGERSGFPMEPQRPSRDA